MANDNFSQSFPKVSLGAGLSLLLICYIAILLVDVFRVFRPEFVDNLFVPLLWDFLFREGSIVEIGQWIFLGVFTIASAYVSGSCSGEESKFWGLLSIGGVLMLIEDAGNVRHLIIRDILPLNWIMLNVVETFIFLIIGLPFVIAVMKYRRPIFDLETTRILLALGIVFYVAAAFISGPADITEINNNLGSAMENTMIYLSQGELKAIHEETNEAIIERYKTGYMDISARYVDFLLEESLELLGAIFLSSAALTRVGGRRNEKG